VFLCHGRTVPRKGRMGRLRAIGTRGSSAIPKSIVF
jgi:hypothetical protein